MSVNLPNFFVKQYATNIQVLLQQKQSRFSGAVMSGTHVGNAASPVDQVGSVEMQPVTGRFQPMGRVDAATDLRWVYPSDFDLPQLIDSFDKLRLIVDPQSTYVQNAVYAANRQRDRLIISAFTGAAKTGLEGANITNPLSSQVIAVNQGAASNTGLTVAKIRKAKQILMQNEVDLESDSLYIGVTARQHDDLFAEVQVISLDYNEKPVLADGKITRFMGFNFIHSELLLTDGSGYRRCPFWAKSGMYLGSWNEMKTSVAQRHDLQGEPWQTYVYMTAGATRLEEKRIGEIKCSEA